MKRLFTLFTVFAVAAVMIVPAPAKALTAEELQLQINQLLNQLSSLQAQLGQMGGTTGGTITGCTVTSLTRNLAQGSTGADVKCVQIILNSDATTRVASTGAGSPGNETTYYGSLTTAAVKKFQAKYGTGSLGTVGPNTRAKMNQILAAGPTPTTPVCGNGVCETGETSTSCPADCGTTPPPAAGGLSAMLAGDTPVAGSIASGTSVGANADFTKFILTAGSGPVKITKIYVTRTGLSTNSDIENIKIVDAANGAYYGNIASLNVDNRAMVTFTPALEIAAGTSRTFYIRAAVNNGVSAGKTVALGIASASDIVSDASSVAGAFPITGANKTVVTLDIGTATIYEETTTDSTPDIGDNDVQVSAFKISAGSTEAITIESITGMEYGSASLTDVKNIELYDVTDGKSLGTVASYNAEGKVTWSNLNIVVGKGETHRFKILVDVVGGASLTTNIDLIDGTDVLVNVKGNTYGFYITPSNSWTSSDGLGTNQTIGSGTLVVSKSSTGPATGNIAVGDDITLGAWDIEARGEEMRITQFIVTVTVTDLTGSSFTAADVTNVKLYDENGSIVAGPNDPSSGDVTFTDTFIVPVGIHKYTLRAKVGTDAATGDTIIVDAQTPDSSITARGMTTNDSPTITPSSDVACNTLTVAAGDLNVVTLSSPSGRAVAKGTSDFVWATFSLDAGTSGEDISVTSITVTNDDSTYYADINNAELWADLTSANSSRGDVYETKISDTKQPAATTQAFPLSTTITVAKGTSVRLALVADLDASANTSGSHVFSIAAHGDMTSTGVDTGSSIQEDVTTTYKQSFTVSSYGVVTVTRDSSIQNADIILGGQTATLNVFRIAANNVEDMDLDNIRVTVTGGDDVDTYYFYNGDTLVGSVPGSTLTPRVDFADVTVTIPANGYAKITLKAKMKNVDGSITTSDTTVGASISTAGYVGLTGLSSQQSISSTDVGIAGLSHQLYETRPYFSLASVQPSGTISAPSSTYLLAVFDVTAASAEDVTFNSSHQVLVNIEASPYDTNGTAGNWYLKDEAGTTYATTEVADASLAAGSSVTFAFNNNTFTVPAGQTKKMYIYGDLSDFEAEGTTGNNSIQLWLDDAANNNCQFGIDGSGDYAEGAIIFRGDIWAVTHSN